MSPFLWLAWRLPGNVQVYRTANGKAVLRTVKFTVWNWIKWQVRKAWRATR